MDTNVFLDLIVENCGKRFEESKDFLDRARKGHFKIVTSNLVLAEVVWVLQSFYKMDRVDIAKAVRSLLNIAGLKFLNKDDWKSALTHFVNKKVKYIDAVIASIEGVSDHKVIVVSYDLEFDKLGVKRMEPREINKNPA